MTKRELALSEEKKLKVTFRVEPGCLGPNGAEMAEAFCQYAQANVATLDSNYIIWNILPRFDKTLPELEYHALNKRLNHQQAEKYLMLFSKSLDEFESHLEQKLSDLIESFCAR